MLAGRRGAEGLDVHDGSLHPLGFIEFAFVVLGRMAGGTLADIFDEVAPEFELFFLSWCS